MGVFVYSLANKMITNKNCYKRPLLKLSGEMLGGKNGASFDKASLEAAADTIKRLTQKNITPAVVVGGGNLMRGAKTSLSALRRHKADAIGMLGTVMNGICLTEHLLSAGVKAKAYSAVPITAFIDTYNIDDARQNLDNGVVCVFTAGTAHPYFSTDTCAALRAIEVGCDVVIKGTKVDGIYDSDPLKNPNAKKYDVITYDEIITKRLGVIDIMAAALCAENKMPLKIISLKPDIIIAACGGENVGTSVVASPQI